MLFLLLLFSVISLREHWFYSRIELLLQSKHPNYPINYVQLSLNNRWRWPQSEFKKPALLCWLSRRLEGGPRDTPPDNRCDRLWNAGGGAVSNKVQRGPRRAVRRVLSMWAGVRARLSWHRRIRPHLCRTLQAPVPAHLAKCIIWDYLALYFH